jgi:hypothetical protein
VKHVKISYRDFFDFPRVVIFDYEGGTYLLDCVFDERMGEFADVFVVWQMPNSFPPPAFSWKGLHALAVRRIGEIPATRDLFDPTFRATIDVDLIWARLKPAV